MEKEEEKTTNHSATGPSTVSSLTLEDINKEDLTIEDLHEDMERKLKEEGFTFDKQKFIFQDKNMSFGERLADKVASFGGSWVFIIIFGVIILTWITINLIFFLNKGFDPYPFILLNLCLSCLTALQAPIIMMSQNRQATKERHQQEINLEKDIIDFKQDRLDLILDQKEYEILQDITKRLDRIESRLDELQKPIKTKHKK